MPDPTTNFAIDLPNVAADADTWGTINNAAHESWDGLIFARMPKAGGVFSGAVSYSTSGLAPGGTHDLGYRGAPVRTRDSAYTFVLTDAGELQRHTEATARAWTIPTNASVAFPIGTIIPIRNANGAGAITLSGAGGVTLNWAGSTSTASRTLAAGAYASITQEAANVWVLTGAGIT
jgi:hypothetical protein